MIRLTCSKTYSDLPAAHRQWTHDGHCALIHGHNWSVEFTFSAEETDENGFVVDFGKLSRLKNHLTYLLDHTLLLRSDDPFLETLKVGPSEVRVLDDVSSEGLAKELLAWADHAVGLQTEGRVSCIRCTVYEDSKNHATASHV